MAEGAIEGEASDYEMASPYATAFKYSAFDRYSEERLAAWEARRANFTNGGTLGSAEATEREEYMVGERRRDELLEGKSHVDLTQTPERISQWAENEHRRSMASRQLSPDCRCLGTGREMWPPSPPPPSPPPPLPPSPSPPPPSPSPPPAEFAGSFMSASVKSTLIAMLNSRMPSVIHNSHKPMVLSKWKLCFRKSDASAQPSLCHVFHTRCDQGVSPVGEGNAVAGQSVNRAHTVSVYKWPSGSVSGGATTGFAGGWGGSGYPSMCGSGFPCGYLFSLTSDVVWSEQDISSTTYAAYGVYRSPANGPSWGGGVDFQTSCGMDQATVYQDEPANYGYTYQTFDANVMMGKPSGTSTIGWHPFDDMETWVYDQDGAMDYSVPY